MVVGGGVGRGLVAALVAHAELKPVTAIVGRDQGVAGERDAGAFAAVDGRALALVGRRGVGDEDAFPMHGASGQDVADVENRVGKRLVEDARHDLGGELGGADLVDHPHHFGLAPGRELDRAIAGEGGGQQREQRDRAGDAAAGDAGGAQGDDLAVVGHAAEGDQRAGQHAQWDGVGQGSRDQQQEQVSDHPGRSRAVDQNGEQAAGLLQKNDQQEKRRTQGGAG